MKLIFQTLLVCVLALPAMAAPDTPVFSNDAAPAGVSHIYGGPWEFYVGGGATAFDCDGDLKADLLLAGGENSAQLYRNTSKTGGGLSFRPADSGVNEKILKNVIGAYALDIDSDGILDLAVMRLGENVLLRGQGDCRFENANRQWRFDGGHAWTTAFSATWEKGARFPTLAFGNYVDRDAPGSPWGTCSPHYIYRPGSPTAGPDYSGAQEIRPGYCTLGMLFSDFDRSGTPSLRITNDRHYYRGGEEQLVALPVDQPARLYKRADGWQKLQIWGMGIAAQDIDGDGYLEYGLTSMGDTKIQRLQRPRDQEPVFEDMAFAWKATAHRPYTGTDQRPSTGWHIEFQDFNNDSRTDVFIAKGNVEAMPDFAENDPDNLLIGQWDGTFAESGLEAGLAQNTRGRGAAIADFNLDGQLDIALVNREGKAALWRNQGSKTETGTFGPMGNYAAIRLRQADANRNAIGSEIRIRVGTRDVSREVLVGGGHAGGTHDWVHFGMGVADRATVRVRWPDGKWGPWQRLFANQFVVIDRNQKDPIIWVPPGN
ncbi:MAG: VCBS repeat-containing protein [Rhodospirillales bacterium]|nr:VCBS repeat-containing protein [Rhodospirillales bacterium]